MVSQFFGECQSPLNLTYPILYQRQKITYHVVSQIGTRHKIV